MDKPSPSCRRCRFDPWSGSQDPTCLVANKATHKTEACSLSGSSGDADIKSRLGDTAGEGESGRNGESGVDAYPVPCVKQTAGGNAPCHSGSSTPCSVGTARGGVGWEGEGVQAGGDVYACG